MAVFLWIWQFIGPVALILGGLYLLEDPSPLALTLGGLAAVIGLIVGIVGCFFGGWLFDVCDLSLKLFKGDWKWLNNVIIGAIGAFIILVVINLVFKKKK